MQQPMNQAEPIGGQQAVSSQMVLCPVRFVYETQVLVQPGDQIPPNQTFFINPQNPPPWMQNRPASNPVVYVQQLQNNMIHQVQQPMDQNQLYLQQNFANFQIQPHMLTQNPQEMRPMQIANIMPNMVQNVQQNMQSNDRNMNQQNTGQLQTNQSIMPSQMNVPRQMTPSNPTMEIQRLYMNVRPQMSQQLNPTRPVMSLNQMQNMQAMANMQNVQLAQGNIGPTFVQNIGPRLPQNVNAVRPQIMANVINSPINKPPTDPAKSMGNTPVQNVRNFAQNYNCRPIQPRRRFVENANVPKMQPQSVPMQTPQPQHIPVQTAPTQHNQEKANSHQVVSNIAANTTFLNNPNVSRKRKSESPDEIQNKIAVPPTATPIYRNLQQGIIITKLCNDIGTNTSPVHKPKINANNPVIQVNSNAQMIIVENAEQIDENLIKNITESRPGASSIPNENDKLIRNTVFTQARGRVLQDKISETVPQQIVENKPPESLPPIENKNSTETNTQTENSTTVTETPAPKAPVITQPEKEIKTTEVQPAPATKKPENKPEAAEKAVTEEKLDVEMKDDAAKVINETKEDRIGEKETKDTVNAVRDEKAEVTNKTAPKQDILTHVVDGYVIQESNFAFPIRKPLKEKTLYANSKKTETTDALKECMKEEMKNTGVDVQALPFHYLLLNEKRTEDKDTEDDKKKDPFADLLHATVKSWTVEDLSSHLLKYEWKETVAVFQDHEIDGESLFLVSKPQLMSIGVSEENADTICAFVRS